MMLNEDYLTPAPSNRAGPNNYTWWNGEEERFRPLIHEPGFIFPTKEGFAAQIMKDYPEGREVEIHGSSYSHGFHTVVGGDGFGWIRLGAKHGPWTRWPHIGGVWFGKGVELGSNVTIDRGQLGDTEIASGVKIDNGVHIGHGAWIGHNTRIAAHAVIGGSAIVAEECWIGLSAVIKQHVVIGAGAIIGMGAVVLKDVGAGETWVGNPARKLR